MASHDRRGPGRCRWGRSHYDIRRRSPDRLHLRDARPHRFELRRARDLDIRPPPSDCRALAVALTCAWVPWIARGVWMLDSTHPGAIHPAVGSEVSEERTYFSGDRIDDCLSFFGGALGGRAAIPVGN